ncbi:DUF4270 family protein [Pontibacter roseus]|uniref:DUF4270 family protein n=1 Tax=Pontibacter roseus TaxID=336989 RepID=UPI000371E9D4|nr:DUF4270 family protein [Pontibacter roseus]
MNSAVRRLFLFFFSFAALTACEDPTDIGLELQDENLIGTEFTDTVTIQTGTVLQSDSIVSYRAATALVGRYADPVLGVTSAATFAEIGLGGTNVTFGNNAKADSLVLNLDYSFKYADTLQDLQVQVHRLTGAFDEKTSYFTSSEIAFEPAPLGTKAFKPRVEVVTVDGTSTKKTKILSIKLSPELANQFVAQSGQPTFTNQTSFLNFFRGVAIMSPDGANASVLGLNLNSNSSNLTLHYTAGDGTKKTHVFVIGSGGYFSRITTDRSGTAIANLQTKGSFVPSTETGGDTYVQAGAQLLTKLNLPHLEQLKTLQGNLIINRAELLIPVKASSTGNNLPVPPQLVLYETNGSNRILTDATGTPRAVQIDGAPVALTDNPAAIAYNKTKGYYNINITSYLQALLLGQKQNDGLLLGAAIVTADQQSRTRLISAQLNPYRAIITNTEAQPVKLLLYYSKLQ